MSNNDKPEKKVRREPDVGKIIDRTIVRLWDTIEELEALTPAELRFYRVAVFGSARLKSGDQEYVDVRGLASRLTEMGCDIVTGGGPGLMEAANEGAAISRGTRKTRSFGLTIAIPYEKANPYLDSVTAHRTFFSRLHHFVRMSQAFVIFPGGIGTALELFMVWQLLQVGFMTERPVVLGRRHLEGSARLDPARYGPAPPDQRARPRSGSAGRDDRRGRCLDRAAQGDVRRGARAFHPREAPRRARREGAARRRRAQLAGELLDRRDRRRIRAPRSSLGVNHRASAASSPPCAVPPHGPRLVEHRDRVPAGIALRIRIDAAGAARPGPSMPVSSRVSRAQHSSVVSPHSQKPPGSAQLPERRPSPPDEQQPPAPVLDQASTVSRGASSSCRSALAVTRPHGRGPP